MKPMSHVLTTLATVPFLTLTVACGGGGGGSGGGGDTTAAASSAQVAQAVLVAAAAIQAAGTAIDTGTGAVIGSSLSASSVAAAAMGMGGTMPSADDQPMDMGGAMPSGGDHSTDMGGTMPSGDDHSTDMDGAMPLADDHLTDMGGTMPLAHDRFAGMSGGPGEIDIDVTSCGDSGSVDTHMHWMDLNPDTLCVDGLDATLTLDECAWAAGQSMTGTMGMAFTGTSCNPTAIAMDFSGATVTIPDGTLSGDFTMAMTGMMFVGDPTALDISRATVTFDGPMQMAGAGFGTLDMDMDHLAFHFDDATGTGDLNGTLTVRCNGEAFPMAMATDAGGLTLDADGNVVGGHMTVTSHGTAHQVTFNADGSVDVTPAAGEPVHLAAPAAGDFCALTAG